MEKGYFLSADNKTNVAYFIFENKQVKSRAVVQISHGMQDYILRYGDLIKALNNNGIVVCGNDDLGHGYTSVDSSTKGFFAHKDGYKIVVKDLLTTTLIAKEKYKGLPFILLGHSMGSFFARYYAYLYPNQLDGLILCGTSGKVFGTSLGILLLKLVKLLRGEKSYCTTVENMMLKSYFKYIDRVETKREWVTSDEQKLLEYANDPKCNFRFTASAYHDMLKVLKFVNTNKCVRGMNKELPIYICSGSHDPVGDYGNGVAKVYKMFEKHKFEDVELKLYKKARHELHNEQKDIRNEFFNDGINWVNSVIKNDNAREK